MTNNTKKHDLNATQCPTLFNSSRKI